MERPPIPIAEAMEKAKFVMPEGAEKDKKEYDDSMKDCCNPPPCVMCTEEYFAFCNETGYMCATYIKYASKQKGEKGYLNE